MSGISKVPGTRHLMAKIAQEAAGLSTQDRREFLRKGMMAVSGVAGVSLTGGALANTNLPPMSHNGEKCWDMGWLNTLMDSLQNMNVM